MCKCCAFVRNPLTEEWQGMEDIPVSINPHIKTKRNTKVTLHYDVFIEYPFMQIETKSLFLKKVILLPTTYCPVCGNSLFSSWDNRDKKQHEKGNLNE